MNEFSLIEKYFKPLAVNFPGSLNLSDDAALLTPPSGHELVVTKDALSQGIHFIGDEEPGLIAGKALRVNLSDLAAMGATPICYFLALILPKNTSEEWLKKFAQGLKQTGDEFNIALAGGDTTATNGTLSISITAIGSVPSGSALRRSGAKIGDDIYVSGTLGDSALGLLAYQRRLASNAPENLDAHDQHLIARYITPQPRVELGIHLRGIANSAMDISDGLVQDLGHICTTSKVGATIYAGNLPTENIEMALTGGDDYELLFTASADKKSAIEQLAKKSSLPLTCIGKITSGNDVEVLDADGKIINLAEKGFTHF